MIHVRRTDQEGKGTWLFVGAETTSDPWAIQPACCL